MEFLQSKKCLEHLFDQKLFHGACLVVYQKQKVVFQQAFGFNDFENQEKMAIDQIFRAYSITKLVTLVATFLCIEEKLLHLNDPMAKFFPEFAKTKVLIQKNSQQTENLQTPLTIHHLLTMTSGLTYFGNKNLTQIATGKLLKKVNQKDSQMNLFSFVQELAEIPLLFQPGTDWQYGVSFDVLGAVIEKVSGQTFREFCQKKLFQPLKMFDTDFYLLDVNREALVYRWSYENNQNVLKKDLNFHYLMQNINTRPAVSLGGSGLFTTAIDFAKFLNLFLTGCDLKGQRFLKEETLNLIKSDQLGSLRKKFHWTLNQDYSYGYGVRIRLENEHDPLTNLGECGWDGYLGSTAIIDSEKELVACLMLSTAPGHNKVVETDFFAAFYQDLNQLA